MEEVVIVGNTIRPTSREGDVFYGLEVGTNGTGPAGRRALLPALQWTRHDGRPATGLYLTPSGFDSWLNPWGGPRVLP